MAEKEATLETKCDSLKGIKLSKCIGFKDLAKKKSEFIPFAIKIKINYTLYLFHDFLGIVILFLLHISNILNSFKISCYNNVFYVRMYCKISNSKIQTFYFSFKKIIYT